jgi:hypothetical protein
MVSPAVCECVFLLKISEPPVRSETWDSDGGDYESWLPYFRLFRKMFTFTLESPCRKQGKFYTWNMKFETSISSARSWRGMFKPSTEFIQFLFSEHSLLGGGGGGVGGLIMNLPVYI